MILEEIVEDLLQNKFILVVSDTISYEELQFKLKEIYEDIVMFTLVFYGSTDRESVNIEEAKHSFDTVYYI